MRFESSVHSVSWLPSEAVSGVPRLPFDLGIMHYDPPPPDRLSDPLELVGANAARATNLLRAWVEVEDGAVVDCGYSGSGQLSVSTARGPGMTLTFTPVPYPELRKPPERHDDGSVTFVQTAGGRAGFPAPRHVGSRPFVQLSAPTIWTTLSLTIAPDGSATWELLGASPVPRHWIYGPGGALVAKVPSMDFDQWYRTSFGAHTPWGDVDSPAHVTDVETSLERQLSRHVMHGGKRPHIRRLREGETLVQQGERGGTVFLLLDGMLAVEVDDRVVAELGPGAILGERALLEAGRRTSTLRARTPAVVAETTPDGMSAQELAELSLRHHREDEPPR